MLQLVAISIYFYYRGFFFFDVPYESRSLLIVRSLLYTVGFVLFIKSMDFLNPVTAVIAH